jgi:hypothetical protein
MAGADVKLPTSVPRTIYIAFLAVTLNAIAGGEAVKLPFACSEEALSAAGMACSDEDPCPIYLELSSISASGRTLALAGNLHGRSTTLYSVLLESSDNGATWKEPAERIAGAALDQVQLIDSLHGWAAGETQVPLARDPFILISTDGGASWKKKLVAEEETVGAVQRFWFDSTDHGELIAEARRTYTLYSSDNGGDSWNVVSKKPEIPRLLHAPSGGDPDYRIGTDSRSHTYIIEKRDGQRWIPLASFVIQVANCGSAPAPDGK